MGTRGKWPYSAQDILSSTNSIGCLSEKPRLFIILAVTAYRYVCYRAFCLALMVIMHLHSRQLSVWNFTTWWNSRRIPVSEVVIILHVRQSIHLHCDLWYLEYKSNPRYRRRTLLEASSCSKSQPHIAYINPLRVRTSRFSLGEQPQEPADNKRSLR